GLETHRLEGDVAGEDHQVGPGDVPAIFLLDRPQQPARLVEIAVIRPAIERREALLAPPAAAAAIADAVGARGVPRHADEEWAVMAIVGRPPFLAVRHQGMEVLDHLIEIETVEFLGIVECLAHGIGLGRILMQHANVQLVRPPVADHSAARMRHRALARALVSLCVHVLSLRSYSFPPVYKDRQCLKSHPDRLRRHDSNWLNLALWHWSNAAPAR